MTIESPEQPLDGQVALVTGAARRLGREIALDLAAAGAAVVVHYRGSRQEAEAVADEVRLLGPQAWTVAADLAVPAQSSALADRARELAGRLDILVNNASIFEPDDLAGVTPESVEENLQLNALAPLWLARAFAAARASAAGSPGGQEDSGHVVNLLDTRITDYDPRHVSYGLSKRLLYTITRQLALELAPAVAVNGVAPGLILPPPGQDAAYLERLAHTVPLARKGSAAEIARAVRFLVTSQFITGQVIFVDGGRHLKGCVYG